jgi:hypothetical protein
MSDNTIEVDLPEDSIFRKLMGLGAEDAKVGEEIKDVEKTLSDEEYQKLLAGFLEFSRKQAEANKPENKLKRKLEEMKDARRPTMYRGLAKGFLEKPSRPE